MLKKIKKKIESQRNSQNIFYKSAIFFKDGLYKTKRKLRFLLKLLRYKLAKLSWKLRKKSDRKLDVTLLYLNWKRKDLLLQILADAKHQSGDFKIVVIDNSAYDKDQAINPAGVEVIKADNSNKCWERWIQAKEVNTKYVCVMDDDLTFARRNVLETCYDHLESNPEVDCVGNFGVQYNEDKGYWNSFHLKDVKEDVEVSIVKGRFMFIRTASLRGLDMEPDLTCDDIKVSSHLKKKILLKDLAGGFCDLIQDDEWGVSSQQEHNDKREVAVKKYFKQSAGNK